MKNNKLGLFITLEIVIWIVTTISIMHAIELSGESTCLCAFIIPLLSMTIFTNPKIYE